MNAHPTFSALRRTALAVLPALLLVAASAPGAQAQTFDRAAVYGGEHFNWIPKQVVFDQQGCSYVAGNFYDTATVGSFTLVSANTRPGNLSSDVLVAKFDSIGACLWATAAYGSDIDGANALALDAAGNLFVTGLFNSYSLRLGSTTLYNSSSDFDLFVAKLDGRTGQWLWGRRAGGADGEEVGDVLLTDNGNNVYLSGRIGSDSVHFGNLTLVNSTFRGSADSFIAKLDGTTGTWQWVTSTRGSRWELINSMKLDSHGNIFVLGSFQSPITTLGNTILTTAPYSGTGTMRGNKANLFVAGVDANSGAWQWALAAGDTTRAEGFINATSLSLDAEDNIYVSGNYNTSTAPFGPFTLSNTGGRDGFGYPSNDMFIAKLDTSHTWAWAVSAGGPGQETAVAAVDGTGRLYVAGSISSGSAVVQCGGVQLIPGSGTTNDAFVGEIAPATGNWLGAELTDNRTMQGLKLSADRHGRIRLLGISFNAGTSIRLNPFLLPTLAASTYFLARLGTGPLSAPEVLPAPGLGLMLWPNPAPRAGAVWVSGLAAQQAVQVLDLSGRVVLSGRAPASGPLRLGLPAALAAGTYLVRGASHKQQPAGPTRRLVVE